MIVGVAGLLLPTISFDHFFKQKNQVIMNTQKMLICTAVGTVFLFIIDYVWYGLLMTDYSDSMAEIMREAPLFLWLVIAYVIFSFVFCYLYPAKGFEKIMGGVRYGALVGLLAFVSLSLTRYAVETTGSLSVWLIDSVYSVVKVGLLGAIVAALRGGHRGDETGSGGGES